MENLIPIVLIIFITLSIISYYYLKFKERQLLIEKGFDSESIKKFYKVIKEDSNSNTFLKIGIITICFGLGISLGIWLETTTDQDFFVPLCIFLLTGIGLIIAYIIDKKNKGS